MAGFGWFPPVSLCFVKNREKDPPIGRCSFVEEFQILRPAKIGNFLFAKFPQPFGAVLLCL